MQKILDEAEVAHFELVYVDRLSKVKQPLAEGSSDVVLLDLGLPDSQGLDTFLKVHAQAPELPIVVLTASDSDALALEAMRQGAQDYLVKGKVESNLLVRAICYAIERRQAGEDLRKALAWHESIFEGSRDAIFISDSDSKLIDVNHAACELTGYLKEELLNMRIPDLHEDMDIGSYHKFHNRIMKGEEIISEAKILRKDGSKVDTEFNNRRIIISNMLYMHTVVRDITERKRAAEEKKRLEAQLRQSQKMEAIGTLAGGIAHEFNNILWVIMGNTEISLRKLPENSPIQTKLQDILTASKRAKDMVDQILTFSRQEQQTCKPIKIHLIVKESLKLLKATLPSTIKIHQNIDIDCGTVLADSCQIHQMIMNLCTNAYQAMGENSGLLEVSLGILNVNSKTIKSYPELQKGNYVELIISDTGCGMDKATLERIFEPFFTTREVGEGTGLGLATVHGIVTSLGGAIKVYSEPGKGSTFRVFLPRHNDSVSEEPRARTHSPELKGNEHILFVDDEKQVVSMVQDMLEELGYQITTHSSSVEALKQFSAQPDKFDLVITDQTMPDMTGMELADHILHIRPDIPVILATGYSKLATEEKIN